jgi:hypothetical protein
VQGDLFLPEAVTEHGADRSNGTYPRYRRIATSDGLVQARMRLAMAKPPEGQPVMTRLTAPLSRSRTRRLGAGTLVVLTVLAGVWAPGAFAHDSGLDRTKPTVVLVHGARADASGWSGGHQAAPGRRLRVSGQSGVVW